MKKNLANYGTALSRDEAKKVMGGDSPTGPCVPSGVSGTCSVRWEKCGCGTSCCEGYTCSADIDGSDRFCGI